MKECPVYYNANTIHGKERFLFPIPLTGTINEVEVYVTFRHDVQIVKQKNPTSRFFWLQTNEMPDELMIHTTTDTGNYYHRFPPSKLNRANLIGFLGLLSLNIKP
jgi:hypothetical protein